MKALLYPAYEKLEVADVAFPTAAEGEVLLRVLACGICGSELETFKAQSARRRPPIIMGHEFCGVVDDVGLGVGAEWLGRRVVCNAVVSCGACVRCKRNDTHLCERRQVFGMHRQGAFAEFINVPIDCLVEWPDGVAPEAACLAEPLANGVHIVGLTRHLDIKSAAVIGAGPIGLMCQQALQAMRGARVLVSDLSPERLAVAERLGAIQTIDSRRESIVEASLAATGGEGVDLVIDAVGSAATKRDAIAASRAGGAVVWLGLHENNVSIDSYDVTLPERQIFGTYSARLSELKEALQLIDTGQVDVTTWVQTFPLQESVHAFQRMLAAKGNDIKAVIVNTEESSACR
ncbi:MAG TPA: alcohol dehydrogenase catalytic domain-containing protein [Tepidisphaeraceae bacterium]|jgi:L-iditol 2-dehydrogenase